MLPPLVESSTTGDVELLIVLFVAGCFYKRQKEEVRSFFKRELYGEEGGSAS